MIRNAFTFTCVFTAAAVFAGQVQAKEPRQARSDSKPRLVRRIEFGDYGSKYIRLGDLNGDGSIDILVVQGAAVYNTSGQLDENALRLTCLTALDMDGKIIWQHGKPDPENITFYSDYPVQIYDLDGDGSNEVIYVADGRNILTILEGQTGKEVKTVQLAGGHDSILFADLAGSGRATDLVIKDRYKNFWVYDKDFNLRWQKAANTGHYPIEYDFDHDGRDELLCGYTLYNADGTERWSHPELPQHNDATYIDDMDGDGKAEIAIASSENAYLLDADGKILFMRAMGHCQHALIGKFCADVPGKQVFFLDRKPFGTNYDKTPYTLSNACLFTRTGKLLWNNTSNMAITGAMRTDNWTGNPEENLIVLYERGLAPAGMFDGHGEEIATFPIPEAVLAPSQPAANQLDQSYRDILTNAAKAADHQGKLYDDYYTQHVDCWGDEREEILVFNHKALYIYTNSALNPRPRLYNNNFYPGRM